MLKEPGIYVDTETNLVGKLSDKTFELSVVLFNLFTLKVLFI